MFTCAFFGKAVGFLVPLVTSMSFGPLEGRGCNALFEDAGSFLEKGCVLYSDPSPVFPGAQVFGEAVDGV